MRRFIITQQDFVERPKRVGRKYLYTVKGDRKYAPRYEGTEIVPVPVRGYYIGPGKRSCVVQNQRVRKDLLRQLERRRRFRWAWPFPETYRDRELDQ